MSFYQLHSPAVLVRLFMLSEAGAKTFGRKKTQTDFPLWKRGQRGRLANKMKLIRCASEKRPHKS